MGEIVDHLLDQEIAEADPAQASERIGDRIEDRAIGALGIEPRTVLVEQRLDPAGQALDQRDLEEDQRLARQGRVKERVAAAIAVQPMTQIAPGADLVHGLVFDDLLEQRGRRVPGQPLAG